MSKKVATLSIIALLMVAMVVSMTAGDDSNSQQHESLNEDDLSLDEDDLSDLSMEYSTEDDENDEDYEDDDDDFSAEAKRFNWFGNDLFNDVQNPEKKTDGPLAEYFQHSRGKRGYYFSGARRKVQSPSVLQLAPRRQYAPKKATPISAENDIANKRQFLGHYFWDGETDGYSEDKRRLVFKRNGLDEFKQIGLEKERNRRSGPSHFYGQKAARNRYLQFWDPKGLNKGKINKQLGPTSISKNVVERLQ